MVLKVVDELIQVYGVVGISQDFLLVVMWIYLWILCFVDGFDVVYCCQVVCMELCKYFNVKV